MWKSEKRFEGPGSRFDPHEGKEYTYIQVVQQLPSKLTTYNICMHVLYTYTILNKLLRYIMYMYIKWFGREPIGKELNKAYAYVCMNVEFWFRNTLNYS